MGVLNVTPDSFSDGGRWLDFEAAVAHGRDLVAEGADIVDVGGESTRPGAEPVPLDEELRRVVPVVRELAPHVRVSVDTRKPEVAAAAVEAGASIVNDVSASLHQVAASTGAGWIAMHMKGDPRTMQRQAHYDDVMEEVRSFLVERAEAGRAAGVGEVWVDPGIGFAKTAGHNLTLLARLGELVAAGWPVVVGTSRKTFLGTLTGGAPVEDRLEGSLATATWAMAQGAAVVRVHDVRPTVQAARIVGASEGDA
jgi:dihydropteroate synthase